MINTNDIELFESIYMLSKWFYMYIQLNLWLIAPKVATLVNEISATDGQTAYNMINIRLHQVD